MWPGTESNRRHEDFQSSALPTELPGHTCKNIYLAGLLWGFKRSCGRAAIIMRLDPALGRSRQDLGRAKFSAICDLDPKTPYATCQNLDEGQVGL
jgi:hypothetical protein